MEKKKHVSKYHTEPHDKYKFFTLSIQDPLSQLSTENPFGLKNKTNNKDKDISTMWSVSLDMKYKVRISRKTPST